MVMDSKEVPSKFFSDLHQFTMTKEMLKSLRVIGQVDKKFIVTSLKHDGQRYLIVLDQHAVDERLRLEHLQKKFREEMRHSKSTKLANPLQITLFTGDATAHLLAVREDLQKSLEISGVRCQIHDVDGKFSLIVNEFPLDLLQKIIRKPSRAEYLDYVKETITRLTLSFTKQDRCFGGNFFAHVLASEACARAIKFGDSLSQSMMSNMLTKLSTCDMPFQCAHGRPTLTVIKCDLLSKERVKTSI